jgi:hypothetical protein
MHKIFVIIGMLASLFSGGYLLSQTFRRPLWRVARFLYGLISLVFLYLALIYALTVFGVLGIDEYGYYVRPILSLIVLAPTIISMLHRKHRTGYHG